MAEVVTHRPTTPSPGADPSGRVHFDRARAVMARDAALARIGRARVLMLVVAVALTALLAAMASALLPGKSLGATSKRAAGGAHPATTTRRVRSHRTAAVAPKMPAPAGPAELGLQAPGQAPQSVPPPPPVTQSQPSAPVPSAPAPAVPSGGGAVVSGGS
jgi:hypothetical protein